MIYKFTITYLPKSSIKFCFTGCCIFNMTDWSLVHHWLKTYPVPFHPSMMGLCLLDAVLPRFLWEGTASPSFPLLPCRPPLRTLESRKLFNKTVPLSAWNKFNLLMFFNILPFISRKIYWGGNTTRRTHHSYCEMPIITNKPNTRLILLYCLNNMPSAE